MKKIATNIIFALIALLLGTTAMAQTFDNVSIAEASSVCSIAQDEQGLLWLGTEHGLYPYDGFRTIQHNTAADGTPVSMRIHSMLMRRNMLYMATERGLLVYDIRRGDYIGTGNDAEGDIRTVAEYGGRLWYGGARGLFSRNLQSGQTRTENAQLNNVYTLLATKHGLLVGTISGLWLQREGKLRQLRIGEGRQPLVNALLADAGNVWIGTEGALYSYDWHTMTAVPALTGNSVKSLSVNGSVIFAGTDDGLYTYNKATRAATHAVHDSRSAHSLANNIVWAVFNDRWGNLWAGTDQGVSWLRKHRFFTYTPLSDITRSGDGNCLHLIYRSADGMLWLGGTNGLIGYHTQQGLVPRADGAMAWFRQNSTAHYMSHNRVRRVYADREGTVIVCTDHGLNIYNPRTRQMRNIIVTDPSRRYNTAWVYDIVDDGKGCYWVCSYMGGVFVIAKEKLLRARTETVVCDRHFLNELQGMHVWQLVADGRGRIWVRMYDHGLDRIDARTMRVEHIVGKERTINDMCADHNGNIWVAMDGEIRCFGMKQSANRSIPMTSSGANKVSMLCEVEGNIWAIGGHDCCILTPSGASTRFALPDFQPLAICYDKLSGCVLLGGNDAIVSVPVKDVAHYADGQQASGVARNADGTANDRTFFLLSGLLVDGKPYAPNEGAPTYLSEITLSAQQNNLTFLLTDLPMAGKQPHVYAYRIEGIDHTWQYLYGERKEINYSALPSGTYTLEVCEMDGLGNTQNCVFSYTVTILPPWYLSGWAKLFYLLVVIGLAVWAMNFAMMRRRLHEEREAKERVMEESTARQAFFDNLSTQLKRPLSGLFATVIAMLHEENDTRNMQRVEQMRRDVVDINTLVYKSLDMQHGNDKTTRVHKTRVDIVDFCRREAEDARTRHGKKADIGFHTDVPTAYVDIDIVRMQPVLAQLLDFAVERRNDGEAVKVDISTAGDMAVVAVDIPGSAVPEADMPFVFNRYYSADRTDGRPFAGISPLATVHEAAVLQGADARAENAGSALRVSIGWQQTRSAATAAASAPDNAQGGTAKQPLTPTANDADARLLAKITDTVEAHMADSDFNVTHLQEELGLGSKLLYRKVKQMTGKTPVEFIRHIRMQRAAVLLREGKFSVSEVMYMVGFSNSSYFSKMFQKAYGITPTEYSRG